jgi:anaerobic glycerol-3-phosphate dehydrogenase
VICVLGGGLVGMTLALAAAAGITAHVVNAPTRQT